MVLRFEGLGQFWTWNSELQIAKFLYERARLGAFDVRSYKLRGRELTVGASGSGHNGQALVSELGI